MADLYSWEEGVFSMTCLSVIVSHFPIDAYIGCPLIIVFFEDFKIFRTLALLCYPSVSV